LWRIAVDGPTVRANGLDGVDMKKRDDHMTIANTRIQKELKQFHKGPPPVGIALWMPDESDVTQLRASKLWTDGMNA
jgi:hypothetical protein